MQVTQFSPESIPSLSGKTIFITGGTSGIAYQTILELSKHDPGHIVFTGRNRDAAERLIAATALGSRISFIPCDMTSFASVKACVKTFLAEHDKLDVLLENAGIAEFGGEATLTPDGWEQVWQVNYLSHALMDSLLLPVLARTPNSRLIIMSSELHKTAPSPGIDYATLQDAKAHSGILGSQRRYGRSKLANMFRADEVARRYPLITAVSLHPGIVGTDMVLSTPWYVRWFMRLTLNVLTPEQGSYSQLWAMTSPDVVSGKFYNPIGEEYKRGWYATPENAEELWDWTEATLKSVYGSE